MVGGAVSASGYATSSEFTPGATIAYGLIPLAGPLLVWDYWMRWGDIYSVEPFLPLAIALTVVEAAGAALLVVGLASKRSRAADALLLPSPLVGGGALTLVGRF